MSQQKPANMRQEVEDAFFFDELLGSSAIVGNPKSGVDQHWDQLVLSMGKESFNTQKSSCGRWVIPLHM